MKPVTKRRARPPKRPVGPGHKGFLDAIRRFDELLAPEQRDDEEINLVLSAIDDRLGEEGPRFLNTLVDRLRGVLGDRYRVETEEVFGARMKAMRDEARLLQQHLRKWLRRAVAFYGELA